MSKNTERKICVVTGTRSEYGILRPVMKAVRGKSGLRLQVVASGMHLSREFGHTVDAIVNDGFDISARVRMLPENDTPSAMAESVGRGVVGFTKAFKRLAPDIVVVLGDRTEAFAAASAAVLSGRLLAHIHGGDRAEAGFDDYMRHAITKMAHIHLAATKGSAKRILRMGEERARVFVVGAPGLDEIRTTRLPAPSTTKKSLGLSPSEPLVLLVQHSVSTESRSAASEMKETLGALLSVGAPTVAVYPNSDAGGRAIIKVLESFEKAHGLDPATGSPRLITFKSMPREKYLAVMKAASVMVGNSSSGIIEAASLSLPVVNIGRRQAGRERSGNTVEVPHEAGRIEKAVRRILGDSSHRARLEAAKNIYGDGRSSQRIARILAEIEIFPEIYRKQIVY